jgi:hypothetical protein
MFDYFHEKKSNFYRLIFYNRLQPYVSNNDKESPNIVADDVSSCDEDESESEEQDENKLPMVIVRGMNYLL